ncbi:MAG: type II toxin-antitoxin system RelE/ParE family toxin [Calditrichota bacterium]
MIIELTSHAERQWERLQRNATLFTRIEQALDAIASDYLVGKPLVSNLAGMWSYRVGDYRILYEVRLDRDTILIHEIAHRKEVYR